MKKLILLGIGLVSLYIVSRLINLGIIPIFTDEAIYLRWSQIMTTDASLRYLPLIDGKPPLFMWGTTIIMKLLPMVDPLLTGRLMSTAAGLLALPGVFFTSWMIFKSKKISFLSVLLYIFVPFTFFYDRFGTADSLLAAIGIWSLGLSILLVETVRLDVAMILGIVLGMGFLTKTPALFFLLFSPLALIFKPKNFSRWLPLFIVAVVFSQAIYSILRLFPLFHMIAQKNMEFAISFSEFFKNPLAFLPGNLRALLTWEFIYLTPLVSLFVVIGLFKKSLKPLYLFACFLGFTFAMATFNKVIYPRFLLIFTPGLLILAAAGLSKVPNKILPFVLGLVLIIPAYTNYKLWIDPINAPIPDADSVQYLNGWAAGFGVKEVREFLATHPNSTVITEGTFGLMPYALDLYQKDYPTVTIKSVWPLPEMPPAELKSVSRPIYVLMYQNQDPPEQWKLKEVLRFRQGNSNSYLRLYQYET